MRYLHYDPDTLDITGAGFTPDGTYPLHTIACTQAQADAWRRWKIQSKKGKIILVRVDGAEGEN